MAVPFPDFIFKIFYDGQYLVTEENPNKPNVVTQAVLPDFGYEAIMNSSSL